MTLTSPRAFLQLAFDWWEPDTQAPQTGQKAKTLPSAPPPHQGRAIHRHAQANRETILEGIAIAYRQTPARRKTIGFSITPLGLEVRTPRWVSQRDIHAALQERSHWILKKMDEMDRWSTRMQAATLQWESDHAIDYLGQPIHLPLDLPAEASAQQRRDAAARWLQRQAQTLFEQRLNHYAPVLGVQWTRLSLSHARTRWGCAGADGSIRLNWRLIHFSLPIIDYVVVHELSHLRHMNHSSLFWATVETVLPEYRQLRKTLRTQPGPQW